MEQKLEKGYGFGAFKAEGLRRLARSRRRRAPRTALVSRKGLRGGAEKIQRVRRSLPGWVM